METNTTAQEENALASNEVANLLGERELVIALHGRSTIEPGDQEGLSVALAKKELEAQGVGWLGMLFAPRAALKALGNNIVMVRMANNRISGLAREKENLTAALEEATRLRHADGATTPGQAR